MDAAQANAPAYEILGMYFGLHRNPMFRLSLHSESGFSTTFSLLIYVEGDTFKWKI